jgi:hypothetical protein
MDKEKLYRLINHLEFYSVSNKTCSDDPAEIDDLNKLKSKIAKILREIINELDN